MPRLAVHTAKPLSRSGLWRLNQILFANTPNTEKDQANRGQCPLLLASDFTDNAKFKAGDKELGW